MFCKNIVNTYVTKLTAPTAKRGTLRRFKSISLLKEITGARF